MKHAFFNHRRSMAGLLGALLLSPALLTAGAVHAAGSAPGTAAQYHATVPTNDPHIFAFHAPPAGFNAATAGTADLQRYGFPLPPDRSKYPKEYQHWLLVMSRAKHQVVPTFTPKPGVKHATSPNWSGAVTFGSPPRCSLRFCAPGYAPTEVWGGWTVPNVDGSSQTSYSSTWVGLDGWGNGQVEQMGTDQQYHRTCFIFCFTDSDYFAWFELYPDSEQQIDGFSINPGDIVWADVHYYASDNMLTFWLENLSSGQYAVFETAAKYGCACASAEWITERPTEGGSLSALAEFVHTHISDAYFRLGGSGYEYPAMAPGFGAITVNMVNGSGTTLVYGYTPAPDQVDSLWVNYS